LHVTTNRGVLAQGEVRPDFVIVGGICGQNAPQMALSEHQDMIQTFAAD
jgi:hypothetical protein